MELIQYVIKDGVYIASFFNLPATTTGESYEEMMVNCKNLYSAIIGDMTNTLNTNGFKYEQIDSFIPNKPEISMGLDETPDIQEN